MSVYKFLISKNNIAKDSDSNITYDDTNGGEDVSVTLTVNGTVIHAVTLGDAGAVLQYTGTLAAGFHTVKIQPEAGKPTDIRIDKVLIDDHVVVASQYKLDTRIFGAASDYLRFKACPPFRATKGNTDYVWWGDVYKADYTIGSRTEHYRPHLVTDLGEWWEWSFTVTSNGHIHWTVDNSDSILYDSTENMNFYAAKSILDGSTTFPVPSTQEVMSFIQMDSSTLGFPGVGTYAAGDSSVIFRDSTDPKYGTDSSPYDDTWRDTISTDYNDHYGHMAIYSEDEWINACWYHVFYWPFNNIDPIVVS
jgi:hypothetical protein